MFQFTYWSIGLISYKACPQATMTLTWFLMLHLVWFDARPHSWRSGVRLKEAAGKSTLRSSVANNEPEAEFAVIRSILASLGKGHGSISNNAGQTDKFARTFGQRPEQVGFVPFDRDWPLKWLAPGSLQHGLPLRTGQSRLPQNLCDDVQSERCRCISLSITQEHLDCPAFQLAISVFFAAMSQGLAALNKSKAAPAIFCRLASNVSIEQCKSKICNMEKVRRLALWCYDKLKKMNVILNLLKFCNLDNVIKYL